VVLGKVDYVEIVGFSDHRATAAVWYRLLNLGFRIPAAGGTDAMANYASLRGPVGMNRTFVRVDDGPLQAGSWLEGLRRGRSVASNGPLLDFTLGGQPVGAEVSVPANGESLTFTASLRSIVPVDHLEVVCNGAVVRNIPLPGNRTQAQESGSVPVGGSGWCLLRASSDQARYPVLDSYAYATTSPVYVTQAGTRPHDPDAARYFVAWIDRMLERTQAYPDWNSPAEKDAVLSRLGTARARFVQLQ